MTVIYVLCYERHLPAVAGDSTYRVHHRTNGVGTSNRVAALSFTCNSAMLDTATRALYRLPDLTLAGYAADPGIQSTVMHG